MSVWVSMKHIKEEAGGEGPHLVELAEMEATGGFIKFASESRSIFLQLFPLTSCTDPVHKLSTLFFRTRSHSFALRFTFSL